MGWNLMPYFITKETINKSILEIFTNAKLGYEEINLIGDDLINFTFNVPNNKSVCEKIKNINFVEQDLFEIADMLFQLKDYKFYLSYILNMLINTEHFNDIAKFFSRTFVNHIGDVSYVSKDASYDFNERYFDRFIEAVKYSEIDNFKIIPFLFYIYSSKPNEPCNKFLRPAKEFLKGIISNNEASYLNYINTEENYKQGYLIYVDLFSNKGAQRIIENLVTGNYFSKDELYEVFLENKQVGLSELKSYILKQSGEKQKIALNFYLTFSQDVKNTLPELYNQIKDEELKNILKDEIELSKNIKFETIKDFIDFVDLNLEIETEVGISTKFLTYFKNGVKVSDKVLTYIFNIFKNISSPLVIKKYAYLKDFFPENELNNLGKNLFASLENKITWDNKWIVALICTLCSDFVVSDLVDLTPTCLGNTELSNFVLGCLVETNVPKAVSLIKQLYMESNNKKIYYNFLEILAKNNSISALDYLDEMVSNFGLSENGTKQIVCNGDNLLFEIDDNLTVKVKNMTTQSYVNLGNPNFVDTADALKYFNELTNEIRHQIDKFKEAYQTKRYWSIATFKANILSNPILKKIASTLIWGGYEKDALKKVYVNFNEIAMETEDVKVALIHPVEIEQEKLPKHKFEPFKQINKQVFVANNYNYSNTLCNEFNGIAINEINFNSKIRAFGYKMSVGEDVYYYKAIPHENLLVKIELIKLSTKNVSVLGNIKFYNLNLVQVVNNKFVLSGTTPEEIGSINKRVYSDVLNDVFEACYY